jgi:putative hydrolase of the HAD superfamily
LPVRAVVFDYGMVLTGPPDADAHGAMVRITGLSPEKFDSLYWADRLAFDAGSVTGKGFWQEIAQRGGLQLDESAIDQLVDWDARMWLTENAAMVAWQLKLKEQGILTAIVSNMGDTVHEAMERELTWLARFDVLVWSYQLKVTKPDAAIYRYVLAKLRTRPEETVFIDDRRENVDAAIAMGMKGFVFRDVERLRADLEASGLGESIPLP